MAPTLRTTLCRHLIRILFAGICLSLSASSLRGQNIGWEGETGVFVTPLAYTAASPAHALGRPIVASHYLSGGAVIGNFEEISFTEGIDSRFEVGYTRSFHQPGGDPSLSPLWHDGFDIFHGKINLLGETAAGRAWVPAVSSGFILRSQDHNVGAAMTHRSMTNGDIYLVATKTIPQVHFLPLILNGGVRATDAELFGMGGNAPGWQARGFGAAAFVLKGPAGSSIILGSEISQQPRHPDQLPGSVIPTTLTYAMRVVPSSYRQINLDFGVAQIAGRIAPGVDLHARACIGAQVSYAFGHSAVLTQ